MQSRSPTAHADPPLCVSTRAVCDPGSPPGPTCSRPAGPLSSAAGHAGARARPGCGLPAVGGGGTAQHPWRRVGRQAGWCEGGRVWTSLSLSLSYTHTRMHTCTHTHTHACSHTRTHMHTHNSTRRQHNHDTNTHAHVLVWPRATASATAG